MEAKRVNLFKTEGSSDKVYNVELKELDGAWAVHAFNGRRGKALRLQNKGEGLDYDAALAIYDKVVKSKVKGGYTEHEDGVSFSGAEFAGRKTEFRAQLLNEIALEEAMQLDSSWLVQEKHDGERRCAYDGGEGPVYANRNGLSVGVQAPIDEAFRVLIKEVPGLGIDAEDMGGYLEIFDVIKDPELPEGASFGQRADRLMLLRHVAYCLGVHEVLRFNVPAPAHSFFQDHLEALQERGAEGFVLRHRSAAYTPGRPNSGGTALKVKFWKDVTCRVGAGRDGKRSVGLELLDENGGWASVGNVTIPANAEIPEPGALIDVKYLYAHRGGAIYQPTFKCLRTDLLEEDCRMDRLHYKGDAAPLAEDLEAPQP